MSLSACRWRSARNDFAARGSIQAGHQTALVWMKQQEQVAAAAAQALTVWAHPGRWRARAVSHSESALCGAFFVGAAAA